MKAQAVVLQAPGILVEEARSLDAGSGEALVTVAVAGVCGTDLAIYDGAYTVPLPLVLGHEVSGTVVAVGDDEHESLVGSRVVSEINNTCVSYAKAERCPACAKGLADHCRERTVLGIDRADGAFSTHVDCAGRHRRRARRGTSRHPRLCSGRPEARACDRD